MRFFYRTLVLLYLMAAGSQAFGQKMNKKVIWYYNYNVGSDTLIKNKVYFDKSARPFFIDRFQFYTSGIVLYQKDGDSSVLNETYVLTNGEDGGHDFGDLMLDELTAVKFHLGVDSAKNHSDPSTYPENHPLYHQNPTMHWGWETGYRFWVIEGWIDDNKDGKFDNRFEYHIVGDDLYKAKTLQAKGIEKDGKLFIVINVDVAELLDSIDLSTNNVIHSGSWEAGSEPLIKIVDNAISRATFTVGNNFNLNASGLIGSHEGISIYPNPATCEIKLKVPEELKNEFVRMELVDLKGRCIETTDQFSMPLTDENLDNGFYIVRIIWKDLSISNQRIIVANR